MLTKILKIECFYTFIPNYTYENSNSYQKILSRNILYNYSYVKPEGK